MQETLDRLNAGPMERLIGAVLELWETEGSARTTLKSVTALAQARGSSLYHHFGSMERLFLSAQEHALTAAESWCARQFDFLPGPGLSLEALPRIMAALIDDWCEQNRRLAFAWRECQIMASHDEAFLPLANRWLTLWTDFWTEICTRAGCAERGRLTCHLFDSESLLHLMRWRRPLDRACLDEICEGWGDWLAGKLTRDRECRMFARGKAVAEMPEFSVRGETRQTIANAAADTLAIDGFGALTHRAVAVRAGVTLGVVSYNFRSSADLTRAAFETVYQRSLALTAEFGKIRSLPVSQWDDAFQSDTLATPPPSAMNQLFVEAARSPELATFAPQLRYLRGRSGRSFLQDLAGTAMHVSHLDAALFSGLLTGNLRSHFQGAPVPNAPDCVEEIKAMLGFSQARG